MKRNLYVATYGAIGPNGNTEITTGPGVAVTEAEALGLTYQQCHKEYPKSLGYQAHMVCVKPIPLDVLRAIVAEHDAPTGSGEGEAEIAPAEHDFAKDGICRRCKGRISLCGGKPCPKSAD